MVHYDLDSIRLKVKVGQTSIDLEDKKNNPSEDLGASMEKVNSAKEMEYKGMPHKTNNLYMVVT